MEQEFKIKVNGVFIGSNIACHKDSTIEDFISMVRVLGVKFNEARDVLEVERVDKPIVNSVIVFPTNAFMQVSQFAVETHIDNLIKTYGLDVVMAVFDKTVGIGRAA
jgi:hypothetical protein